MRGLWRWFGWGGGTGESPAATRAAASAFLAGCDTEHSSVVGYWSEDTVAVVKPQNFYVARGADKTLRVTMQSSPSGGVTAWAVRLRLFAPDGTLLLTLLSADGGIDVVNATTGSWDIYLLAADTDLAAGEYGWDFWRVDAGDTRDIASGTCEVYDGLA